MNEHPVVVFLSHSLADAPLVAELRTHLRPLERRHVVRLLPQSPEMPGEDSEERDKESLETAGIIVPILTKSYWTSARCERQLQKTWQLFETGRAHVVPVLLEPCSFDERLERLSRRPADGRPVASWPDRDSAWVDVVEGIQAALTVPREGNRHYLAPAPQGRLSAQPSALAVAEQGEAARNVTARATGRGAIAISAMNRARLRYDPGATLAVAAEEADIEASQEGARPRARRALSARRSLKKKTER